LHITPALLKHLPKFSACKSVIAHLNRESDILIWTYKHRNYSNVRWIRPEPREKANKLTL